MKQNSGISFDMMPCIYWDDSVKLSYLQRRVIVYSIVYYELDSSCISDYRFDAISRQLAEMQSRASANQLAKSKYYYAMQDFDGSTGYGISSRLTPSDYTYLWTIASNVLKLHRERIGIK